MKGAIPPRTPEPGSPDPDEALARLRAADPARDVEPDLDSLREAVAARVAAGAVPDRLAARRSPHRWFAVAAVAAGALVIGGAGFGLGTLTGGGAPAGDVINLSAGAPPRTASDALGTDALGTAAIGTGSPEAEADALSRLAPDLASYPWWPQRVVFMASGLSDVSGVARAWALDAEGVFSAQSAERVAQALGIEARATLQYGSWAVGPQDGTGPTLNLSPDGRASISFYDPTNDPYLCAEVARDESAEAELRRRCAARGSEPAPRGAAAAAEIRRLLASMGIEGTVEVETTEYDVPETGGPRMTSVTAYLVVDGHRAGLAWSANLTGSGVQSFYGPLAPLVALGDYDVVSENEAVRRLGDPRFASYGGPILALAESGEAEAALGAPAEPVDPLVEDGQATTSVIAPEPSDEPTVPPTPEPGSRIGWPVTEVTITKARLGLAQQSLPSGATMLLPAYELSDADGQTWSVLAVADSALDFSAGD